jgi:hypothetical protein
LQDLQEKRGGDERTRTADLLITSWLAAMLVRTIVCRYVAYRRRILGRGGTYRPIAYRRVPTRLQYGCSTFSNLQASPLLRFAPGCTVFRSWWYQSGINRTIVSV